MWRGGRTGRENEQPRGVGIGKMVDAGASITQPFSAPRGGRLSRRSSFQGASMTVTSESSASEGTALQLGAITHVALTVSDLRASVEWYRQLIGSDPVLDEDTG